MRGVRLFEMRAIDTRLRLILELSKVAIHTYQGGWNCVSIDGMFCKQRTMVNAFPVFNVLHYAKLLCVYRLGGIYRFMKSEILR